MISKNNKIDHLWLKLLNKKKKAIHSGIPSLMKMWLNVSIIITAMKKKKN
jgi:transposase